MMRLIFWRLVQLPVLLLAIYTVTFLLAWAVPGNPLTMNDARRPSKEVEAALLAQYNLDNPAKFYFQYLGDATGVRYLMGRSDRAFDLGASLQYRDWRVNQIIGDAFPVSLQLGTAAILLALVVGLLTGVIGAVFRDGVLDWVTLTIALIGISLPTFVTGSVLLAFFALKLNWLPVGGWGGLSAMVMPTVTLSLPFAAYIARLTRLGMLDVLGSDFVRTARAKGVPEPRVVFKHALKVAFLPVLSFLGPAAAAAMTGSFVVEQVFNVPGMGQHFVAAVQNKDLTLIMGVVLLYATLLIFFNFLVDIAYTLVDPRIQLS